MDDVLNYIMNTGRWSPIAQVKAISQMAPQQAQSYRDTVDKTVPTLPVRPLPAVLPTPKQGSVYGDVAKAGAAVQPALNSLANGIVNAMPHAVGSAAKLPAARTPWQAAGDVASIGTGALQGASLLDAGLGMINQFGKNPDWLANQSGSVKLGGTAKKYADFKSNPSLENMVPDTRGQNQIQIEEAINKGDLMGAKKLAQAIKDPSMRQAMLDLVKIGKQATPYTETAPGIYEKIASALEAPIKAVAPGVYHNPNLAAAAAIPAFPGKMREDINNWINSRNWNPQWGNIPYTGDILAENTKKTFPGMMENLRQASIPISQFATGSLAAPLLPFTNSGAPGLTTGNITAGSGNPFKSVAPSDYAVAQGNLGMPYFTPSAQYQLSALKVGELPGDQPVRITSKGWDVDKGKPTGPGSRSAIYGGVATTKAPIVKSVYFANKPGQSYTQKRDTAIHELLHDSVKGAGSINWDTFINDLHQTEKTNPELYKKLQTAYQDYGSTYGPGQRLSDLPKYARMEEMYAVTGAVLKDQVFKTPLGHHYKNILNPNPQPKNIPLADAQRGSANSPVNPKFPLRRYNSPGEMLGKAGNAVGTATAPVGDFFNNLIDVLLQRPDPMPMTPNRVVDPQTLLNK